jgi:sorbitol-specific phosphotransferase system component IIC
LIQLFEAKVTFTYLFCPWIHFRRLKGTCTNAALAAIAALTIIEYYTISPLIETFFFTHPDAFRIYTMITG